MGSRFIGDPRAWPVGSRNSMSTIPIWVNGKQRDLELTIEWMLRNLLQCCCEGESACVTNKDVTLRHEDEVLREGDVCSDLSFAITEGWAFSFRMDIFVIDSATGNKMRDYVAFNVSRAAGANASFDDVITRIPAGSTFADNVNTTFGFLDESTGDLEYKIYVNTTDNTLRVKLNNTAAVDIRACNSNIDLHVQGLCYPEEGDIEGY